jgi:hypothetical protein
MPIIPGRGARLKGVGVSKKGGGRGGDTAVETSSTDAGSAAAAGVTVPGRGGRLKGGDGCSLLTTVPGRGGRRKGAGGSLTTTVGMAVGEMAVGASSSREEDENTIFFCEGALFIF